MIMSRKVGRVYICTWKEENQILKGGRAEVLIWGRGWLLCPGCGWLKTLTLTLIVNKAAYM